MGEPRKDDPVHYPSGNPLPLGGGKEEIPQYGEFSPHRCSTPIPSSGDKSEHKVDTTIEIKKWKMDKIRKLGDILLKKVEGNYIILMLCNSFQSLTNFFMKCKCYSATMFYTPCAAQAGKNT